MFFHCVHDWINSPNLEEPEGAGELEGVGERLIWLCKTERDLLNALGGLFLNVLSCAAAQLY